jgi:uncharacterized repeat protein (TIGR01451 family)
MLAVKEKHMNLGKKIFGIAALIACSFGSQAFAQQKDCIELTSKAEIEQEVVDAAGKTSKQLVPVAKVVPGVEVLWTVTAKNVCQKASDAVTISNPVPQHMTYVANSATGHGTEVAVSADGKTFAKAGELTTTDATGIRRVRADEYKHLRWTFKDALQPGATTAAQFRAVLN